MKLLLAACCFLQPLSLVLAFKMSFFHIPRTPRWWLNKRSWKNKKMYIKKSLMCIRISDHRGRLLLFFCFHSTLFILLLYHKRCEFRFLTFTKNSHFFYVPCWRHTMSRTETFFSSFNFYTVVVGSSGVLTQIAGQYKPFAN
jgi:hypothetical protein